MNFASTLYPKFRKHQPEPNMNAINKSELRRFVKARYPEGRWNHLCDVYRTSAWTRPRSELIDEASDEIEAWIIGVAEKPEWIKKRT
jgi:hypothetical protein